MIGVAPLPGLSTVLRGLIGMMSPHDQGRLAAPWCGERNGLWFSRSRWGLEAVVEWCREHKGHVPIVWVPDYFCNEALEPVRAAGGRLIFYPIETSLQPAWDECRRLAGSAPPDLFLLVHYFGHAADVSPAAEFCRDRGAVLIEDATHVMAPAESIGTAGLFTLYSPYKFLAVPDGGLLCVADPSIALQLREAMSPLASSRWTSIVWVLRKVVQHLIPSAAWGKLMSPPGPFDRDLPSTPPDRAALSSVACRMIEDGFSTFGDIARRRKEACHMLRAIQWPGGARPFFSAEEEGEAPYRFVLDCGSPETARALYDGLNAAGCHVESWPDMPPEVMADPRSHPVAIDLRRRLLFVPVHQTVALDELAALCRKAIRSQSPDRIHSEARRRRAARW